MIASHLLQRFGSVRLAVMGVAFTPSDFDCQEFDLWRAVTLALFLRRLTARCENRLEDFIRNQGKTGTVTPSPRSSTTSTSNPSAVHVLNAYCTATVHVLNDLHIMLAYPRAFDIMLFVDSANLLTPAELAERLRVSIPTLARWRSMPDCNGLPFVRVGDQIRYSSDTVAAYLRERSSGAANA